MAQPKYTFNLSVAIFRLFQYVAISVFLDETEMVEMVPVQIPEQTECSNLSILEMEYKKFEQFLADIEIDETMDSKKLENENRCPSVDLLDGYQCIHTSNMNQLSSMNDNYRAPFISIDNEKAMQEVSFISC